MLGLGAWRFSFLSCRRVSNGSTASATCNSSRLVGIGDGHGIAVPLRGALRRGRRPFGSAQDKPLQNRRASVVLRRRRANLANQQGAATHHVVGSVRRSTQNKQDGEAPLQGITTHGLLALISGPRH